MIIGKLIKSNTHTDYICQIYGPGEVKKPPEAKHHGFGTFVRIPLGSNQGNIVGIIYDTILLNPDFGNLGPRLSPAPDLAVFSPDYLSEKVTLVGIVSVGTISSDIAYSHGVPALAAQIDTLVEQMDNDEIRAFHRTTNDEVCLGYAPQLLSKNSPLSYPLLLSVIDKLNELFPNCDHQLSVMRSQLAWQFTIATIGG